MLVERTEEALLAIQKCIYNSEGYLFLYMYVLSSDLQEGGR